MDNKKFEQLIELIINENEQAARDMLHNIVVEKSREIYESMLEMDDMDEEMHLGGQVGEMMDEITDEEAGMMEADDDMDSDMPMGGMDDMDADMDDMGDELDADETEVELDSEDSEDDIESRIDGLEDRVVSAEDRIDQLMAEFEAELGGTEDAADDAEDAADDAEDAADDAEDAADDAEKEEDDEAKVMEGLVPVKRPSNTSTASHSPTRSKPGVATKGQPVKFSQSSMSTRSAPKVAPGKQYGNTGLGHKVGLSAAPKAQTKPTGGSSRSPLGESKKVSKK